MWNVLKAQQPKFVFKQLTPSLTAGVLLKLIPVDGL
jgi:hypothetical protein